MVDDIIVSNTAGSSSDTIAAVSGDRLTTDARQQLEELAQTAARLLASARYTERQSSPHHTDSTRRQAAGVWSLDIYRLCSSLAPDIVPNGLASPWLSCHSRLEPLTR